MILRLLLLAITLGATFGIVGRLERRRGRVASGLDPGLTLVTASDCRLCGPAADALAAAGARPVVIDVADVADGSVMSVPTAVVVDRSGRVVVRRSGRAVAMDAAVLAAAAQSL
jgi:hypothetical protein